MKMFFQLLRLLAECCALVPEPNELGQPRRFQLCRVNVTLHLAQCDRGRSQAAISVEDSILGILPALVVQTACRALSVFHKPITIAIAVMVYPGQCPFDVGP